MDIFCYGKQSKDQSSSFWPLDLAQALKEHIFRRAFDLFHCFAKKNHLKCLDSLLVNQVNYLPEYDYLCLNYSSTKSLLTWLSIFMDQCNWC